MSKTLKRIGIALIMVMGALLLLRYVLFPIVPVDHLYAAIPDQADLVILIDTEELASLTISEFISSPSSGNPFDDDDEDDDQDDEKYELKDILKKGLWHGLELPEQVIAYVNEIGDQPQIVLLPLSDAESFQDFLIDKQENTGLSHSDTRLWSDSSYTLQVCENYLRLLIGTPDLARDLAADGSLWHTRLAQAERGVLAHLFHAEHTELLAKLELESVAGGLDIRYSSETALGFEPLGKSTDAAAWLAVQVGPDSAQLQALLQSKNRLSNLLKKSGLDPKALDGVWDGRFEICMSGLASVSEEILSYTYDDNFNKIEQRELKEHIEADFSAQLGLLQPSDSLFYKRAWVKTEERRDLFVLYPVQEVLYKEQEDRILLHSSASGARDCVDSPGGNEFLHIDWPELESAWNARVDSTAQLDLGIAQLLMTAETEQRLIRADLSFQDKGRQGLFSLLEILDK